MGLVRVAGRLGCGSVWNRYRRHSLDLVRPGSSPDWATSGTIDLTIDYERRRTSAGATAVGEGTMGGSRSLLCSWSLLRLDLVGSNVGVRGAES
jgi:hypothetical protein